MVWLNAPVAVYAFLGAMTLGTGCLIVARALEWWIEKRRK